MLSEASKGTLEHQGGPMTPQEVENFKAHPHFQATMRMRSWDENAKDAEAQTPSLQHYKDLCLSYLQQRLQEAQKMKV